VPASGVRVIVLATVWVLLLDWVLIEPIMFFMRLRFLRVRDDLLITSLLDSGLTVVLQCTIVIAKTRVRATKAFIF
jgi:hypothetical protein